MRSLLSRKVLGSAAVLSVAALCAGHVACSREPTAVIVAVTTDMVVDGDLDELGLYVGVAGEIKTSLRTPTSADQPAKLPGTLSILQPSDASTPIHVRVAGYKNGSLKVVRDAITTVPSGQLSLLRVPLSWLAATHKPAGAGPTTQTAGTAGNVKIRAVPGDNSFSEFDSFFPGYVSPCAQGQTSADGECVDATAILQKVSSGDLVREVYGGALGVDANGVAEGGTCFDVETCFANEQTLKQADYQNCKVTIPAGLSGPKTVNFAVVRDVASGCTGKACFAPLDWDGKYDEGTSTFTFAPQVCKRIGAADKTIASTRIAVATNCDAKIASRPRCNGLFGAVRDKAPSDPNRAPYYSGEDPNPNDGAPVALPDGSPPDVSTPDAADAAPPGPMLLATLTQVQRPRKLAVANDRLWVRGAVGLGFVDARGPAAPAQFAPLPAIAGNAADDGTKQVDLVLRGNEACAGSLGTPGHIWCYNLTVPGVTREVPDGMIGLFSFDSQLGYVYPSGQFFSIGFTEGSIQLPVNGGLNGIHSTATGRAVVSITFSTGMSSVAITAAAVTAGVNVPASPYGAAPTGYRAFTGRVGCTSNATEAFCALSDPTTLTGAIARRGLADTTAALLAIVTSTSVPYTTGDVSAGLAADDNFVYWGGGSMGPMAISTCKTRPVTAKALFPTAGAQDNTTYAVARAGTKLFFATNDGRVYSMDPPAAEPCP